MFSFKQALDLAFARMMSITGRSSRSEYWWSYLAFILAYIVLSILTGVFAAISTTLGNLFALVAGIVVFVLSIAMLLQGIRRLHDRDMSGWWMLLILVPIIGGLVVLVLTILPGTPGTNRFGINPVADNAGHYNYYTTKQYKQYGAYGAQNFAAPFNGMQQQQFQQPQQFPQGQAQQFQQQYQQQVQQGQAPLQFQQPAAPQAQQAQQAPQGYQQQPAPQPVQQVAQQQNQQNQ